jgi:hypothetical protein
MIRNGSIAWSSTESVFEKSSLEFRLQAAGREKPRKRGTPSATGRVRGDFPNTL